MAQQSDHAVYECLREISSRLLILQQAAAKMASMTRQECLKYYDYFELYFLVRRKSIKVQREEQFKAILTT
jgi:hypothetical protein